MLRAEAVKPVEQALRLDPLGRGREMWERCVTPTPIWPSGKRRSHGARSRPRQTRRCSFELSAAYGSLGRPADAANAVAELRKRRPEASVQDYGNLQDFANPTFISERDRIIEGLRKAGLPES